MVELIIASLMMRRSTTLIGKDNIDQQPADKADRQPFKDDRT